MVGRRRKLQPRGEGQRSDLASSEEAACTLVRVGVRVRVRVRVRLRLRLRLRLRVGVRVSSTWRGGVITR